MFLDGYTKKVSPVILQITSVLVCSGYHKHLEISQLKEQIELLKLLANK